MICKLFQINHMFIYTTKKKKKKNQMSLAWNSLCKCQEGRDDVRICTNIVYVWLKKNFTTFLICFMRNYFHTKRISTTLCIWLTIKIKLFADLRYNHLHRFRWHMRLNKEVLSTSSFPCFLLLSLYSASPLYLFNWFFSFISFLL